MAGIAAIKENNRARKAARRAAGKGESRMSERWYYTAAEVWKRIGWDPQYIRYMARNDPRKLPFPVIVHKSRTQIPKADFEIFFMTLIRKEEKAE